MTVERIVRKASDNRYFHQDFHGALSTGIDYLDERFGEEAVRDYLARFARAYYAPLTADLRQRGLVALEEHYRRVFDAEGAVASFRRSPDELVIDVTLNAAVAHMRAKGYRVARLFRETVASVGPAICEGTPYDATLLAYDEDSGRYTQRFFRRTP